MISPTIFAILPSDLTWNCVFTEYLTFSPNNCRFFSQCSASLLHVLTDSNRHLIQSSNQIVCGFYTFPIWSDFPWRPCTLARPSEVGLALKKGREPINRQLKHLLSTPTPSRPTPAEPWALTSPKVKCLLFYVPCRFRNKPRSDPPSRSSSELNSNLMEGNKLFVCSELQHLIS